MPLYPYTCQHPECGHTTERFRSLADDAPHTLPAKTPEADDRQLHRDAPVACASCGGPAVRDRLTGAKGARVPHHWGNHIHLTGRQGHLTQEGMALVRARNRWDAT